MKKTHYFQIFVTMALALGAISHSQTVSFAQEVQTKASETKVEEVKKQERDPMWPTSMALFEPTKKKQGQVKRKHAPYRVQGKGKSARGAYVIIGGNVIREGETKGEITVVKVGDTKVDILVNGTPEAVPIE